MFCYLSLSYRPNKYKTFFLHKRKIKEKININNLSIVVVLVDYKNKAPPRRKYIKD